MLNMINMDLYRMFKSKSIYVVWIIMILFIGLSTVLMKAEVDDVSVQTENYEASQEGNSTENANLGMSVIVPTQPGEKPNVFDLFYANVQGKIIALFLVIFTVLFATADINNGYIKNIGGQVKNRGNLVYSKIICMFLYSIISMVLALAAQMLANKLAFGSMAIGNIHHLIFYLGIQTLLHFALIVVVLSIAILIRNNVFSMIFAVCLCMNAMVVVYGVLDNLFHKAGVKNFNTFEYTVSGKIFLLPMEIDAKIGANAMIIAVVYILGFGLLSSTVFRKRDI